jgi:hypothetical protein
VTSPRTVILGHLISCSVPSLLVVTPRSVVDGVIVSEVHATSAFRVEMDAAWTSETLKSSTALHGVTNQKTSN